jgi:hypothetical protein
MAMGSISRARERINAVRATLLLTVRQRCFYLFCALALLIVAVPLYEETAAGRIALNALSLLILLSGASAMGRGGGSFVISLLLAAPAAVFQVLGYTADDHRYLVLSQAFAAAFYFITVSYLLLYALRREVLTMDKLYGAAAGYLMMGVMWSYLYNLLLWFHPGALAMNGEPLIATEPSTILYFSFVTLTATGMSDILPVAPVARILCVFEMVTGVLVIAVLIARLAGQYPPEKRP